MKRRTFLTILLAFYPFTYFATPSLNFDTYKPMANQWIADYLVDAQQRLIVSAQDMQCILNLVYFSYMRSLTTITAQESGLTALKTTWYGWQNITQTRLNPSVPLPHLPLDARASSIIFNQFISAQEEHRRIGLTYAQNVHTIVDGNILQSAQAPYAINRLRLDARDVILQVFTDLSQQLSLLQQCTNDILDRTQNPESDDEFIARFGIADVLTSFLPGLALNSFLKTEKCYTYASEQGWSALKKIQQLSVTIYNAIEQARASYYGAYYKAVYALAQQHGLIDKHSYVMFNEDGLLPAFQWSEQLPSL